MYGKRADGRARFRIKIGGYSPIEIKAAAECRIDAINLGYIITYDQSKQFRFTDSLTRHFNPPPPVVRCGAPNSNRNKSTNSHHMWATFVQANSTNILWDICGFYAHITQRHNGQALPSSHALLSLSLTHSPSASFLHHECICVSTWWWECQTPVGIGIETHKRTFCSEHSLLGRTQLLIFARMFCLFIFILFFSSSSFLRHFAWHSSSERPSWVSKWVYAIQCFHICCLRFSHKRIYHIYSISVKIQQITEYAFLLG